MLKLILVAMRQGPNTAIHLSRPHRLTTPIGALLLQLSAAR
jgi:hypothetical protein